MQRELLQLPAVSLDNSSSDECGGALIFDINTKVDTSFACSDIATSPHTVLLSVTDARGNTATCPSSITIVDNTLPTVTCSSAFDTAYVSNTGSCQG